MAHIQKRLKKNGEFSYTVRIRIKNIPVFTITFYSIEEADKWLSKNEKLYIEDPFFYHDWIKERRRRFNSHPNPGN